MKRSRLPAWLLAVTALVLLSACGGGGDSVAFDSTSNALAPVEPAPSAGEEAGGISEAPAVPSGPDAEEEALPLADSPSLENVKWTISPLLATDFYTHGATDFNDNGLALTNWLIPPLGVPSYAVRQAPGISSSGPIDRFPWIKTTGTSLNNLNQIVVIGRNPVWENGSIVRWDEERALYDHGTLTALPDGTHEINDNGVIAGGGTDRPTEWGWPGSAFIQIGDVRYDIPPLPGRTMIGIRALNDNNEVVGISRGNAPARAFYSNGGPPVDLGTLDGDVTSGAVALNDNGVAVGYSDEDEERDNFEGRRAVIFKGGRVYDLRAGGPHSEALSINDSDQIIGWSSEHGGFIYSGGKLTYIRNLEIVDGTDWSVGSASFINNRGQLIGWGRYRGERRQYILTPLTQNVADQ